MILNEFTPARKPRLEHFLIPYYQRGYRWETRHVEALLNDLHNFIRSNEVNYCLQPIVVCPAADDQGLNRWEVIDGQQRLITLHIIFQYLSKAKYIITFEKRHKSTDFLATLSEDTVSDENPDFHFIGNALATVSKWFDQKIEHDISYIDEFYSKVTKTVQVIWYQLSELDEENKINIFKRLNIGKIPLTDAELIRALLLSKVKNGLSDREANMRQAEISAEWNSIEHELRQEQLWYFLNNKVKTDYSSRIEYIFNIIAGDEAKNYSTYLWFEKKVKGINEDEEAKNAVALWNETKQIFAKFKSWFIKQRIYHYVGYLLAENYDVADLLEASKTSKPLFEKWLKDEIKARLKHINTDTLAYGSPELERLFLLFNILTIQNRKGGINDRFPFNHYKRTKYEDGGWSIEHIHAQRSEPMQDEKAIRTWLLETRKAIEHIAFIEVEVQADAESAKTIEKRTVNTHYVNRINTLLSAEKIDTNEFNLLKNELIALFDSSSLHELDNLALLSKKHNSALNNSIFPVKRNKIIELEKQGAYIPACTRNVFLKFYSNSDNQPYYWSKADKTLYFNAIDQVLNDFLNQD
jgi:uncharacterized protein with ParB-like and HNH nuclease domain